MVNLGSLSASDEPSRLLYVQRGDIEALNQRVCVLCLVGGACHWAAGNGAASFASLC